MRAFRSVGFDWIFQHVKHETWTTIKIDLRNSFDFIMRYAIHETFRTTSCELWTIQTTEEYGIFILSMFSNRIFIQCHHFVYEALWIENWALLSVSLLILIIYDAFNLFAFQQALDATHERHCSRLSHFIYYKLPIASILFIASVLFRFCLSLFFSFEIGGFAVIVFALRLWIGYC